MSFPTAWAASCTFYWGTVLIYNFAMEANRRGRYHHRQPPEKQINFFFFFKLHFYPQFSMMASFSKWCAGLLALMWAVSQISDGWGIDSGYDEEILMHIYQLIKGQSQQASAFSFPPLHSASFLSLMPSPWNPPFSGFYVPCLSCRTYTCLPSSAATVPSYSQHREEERWGRNADSPLLQFDREEAPPEQLKI